MRILALFISISALACTQSSVQQAHTPKTPIAEQVAEQSTIDSTQSTLESRFNVPEGFERHTINTGSFGAYLRQLPLKPADAKVLYYDGQEKWNAGVYLAVVDLPIGNKNLHQCADAVMHVRADYLRKSGASENIHFNFTNGFRVDYSEYLKGKNMIVKGNRTYWSTSRGPRQNSDAVFWNYMELIFMYAGTLSLEKELLPKSIESLEIGDVFIQGGSPGHAVIVVDLIENTATGEKQFMLAQSYMPAQELQILQNPNNPGSPWFSTKINGPLETPEWVFDISDLRTWP